MVKLRFRTMCDHMFAACEENITSDNFVQRMYNDEFI